MIGLLLASPASSVRAAMDFTAQARGAITLPSGTTYARASTANSYDKSGVTVTAFSIATGTGRIAKTSAGSVGMLIEPTRTPGLTNAHVYSTGNGYSNGTATRTTGYCNGPDGGTNNAERSNGTSGQFGQYRIVGVLATGTQYVFSQWTRQGAGASRGGFRVAATGFDTTTDFAVTSQWIFNEYQHAGDNGGGSTFITADGRVNGAVAAQARDVAIWGMQYEVGKFATSLMALSDGSTFTRAGEGLTVTVGSTMVSGNRIGLAITGEMLDTPANQDGVMRVWSDPNDATTYCEIATTGVMTCSVAGVTNTTAAIAWAKADVLDLYVAFGGGVATLVKYRVNGGGAVTPAITGSALGTIAPSGALNLLHSAATKPFPGVWKTITPYAAGSKPSWA